MEPAPPQAAEQGNNHGQESAANRNQGPMGKHRMVAAISFLNQQIQIIQDELDELETIGGVSTVCQETRGPTEAGWERWFQGAQSSRSRRRWI